MTRPDRAAVVAAAFCVLDGGICAIAREPVPALVFAGLALVVLVLFWRAPHRASAHDGLEALMEATREEQRFPGLGGHFDEWEQDLNR